MPNSILRAPKSYALLISRPLSAFALSATALACISVFSPRLSAQQPADDQTRAAQEDSAAKKNRQIASPDEANNGYFRSRVYSKDSETPDLQQFSQCRNPQASAASQQALSSDQNDTQTQQAESETVQVKLTADSLVENSPEKLWIKGNVRVIDDESEIRAGELKQEKASGNLSATGGITYESADVFVSADSLTKSGEEESAQMLNTEFYLFGNNANGQSSSFEVTGKDELNIESLTFSTCPGDEKSWELSASEMTIDKEKGEGVARGTTLRLGGVPVFYMPYLSFPTDDRRKSGLLSPSLKYNDDNGVDYGQPIYWNIAPNMDATFVPRYLEKRGNQIGGQYRWLNRLSFSKIDLEWMKKDRVLERQLNDPNNNIQLDADSSDRWYGQFVNQTQFNQNWTLDMDARKASDSNYFRDFGSGLESSNATRLTSDLNLHYKNDYWRMQLFALSNQTLIGNESYRYLPSWTASADYLDNNGWRWQVASEITRFEHKDADQIEGQRAYIQPSVSYPMRNSWGFAVPKLSYQVSWFRQESQLSSFKQNIDRDLPIFSLDTGMFFDKPIVSETSDYTFSFEPRLFYTYIPFREQSQINVFDTQVNDFSFGQLWRENRFSGIDRVGDTNQLSLALGNRLTDNRAGNDKFFFEFGKRFYFEDREVQLPGAPIENESSSPWLFSIDYQVSDGLNLYAEMEYDEKSEQTHRSLSGINFEPRDGYIVNLSHRYRDFVGQDLVVRSSEEADFSFVFPINERWKILGRWYNDLQRRQTVESLAGFEYESCCWAFRAVVTRYLNTRLDSNGMPIAMADEYNDGFYFQFVFKGIGGVGQSSINSLLKKSISGYDDPFAQLSKPQGF